MYMTGQWQLNDGLQVGPVLCTWQLTDGLHVGPVLCTWQDRGSSMMAYKWDQYSVHDRTVAAQ